MNVLFDTNVVLDLLLNREPFAPAAIQLFAHVEQGEIRGVLGATTITTIYYLTAKVTDRATATAGLRSLIALFDVAPVTRAVIDMALGARTPDFEDAVLYEAGRLHAADVVVTRNPQHFYGSRLPIYTPIEFLAYLATTGKRS